MSEEKRLVPTLRFPEFREASAWPLKRLGDFLTESRLPGSKGDVARKITVKLWGNGVFEKNEAIQGSVNTQYFRRKAGQFIYSKLDFLNQAFGIIPEYLDNYESTVDLPCFDFSGELSPNFLLEYVSRKEFYQKVGDAADGSRKAKRIHAETFLSLCLAIPSSVEQKKVANCLNSLDDLIAAQARKVDVLKTHKKALMQQLFPREGEAQPRLRFPECKDEWNDATLGDLCFNVSSGKDARDSEGAFDLYGSTGVIGKAAKPSYTTPHILVARVGANAGYLTKASGNFGVTDNTLVISLKPAVSIDYIFYYLGSLNINKLIFGSGQPLIAGSALKAQRVLVPSAAEQSKIADSLSSISAFVSTESYKLDSLSAYKKGLAQALFPSLEESVR